MRHQTKHQIIKREETTIDLTIGKWRNTHHRIYIEINDAKEKMYTDQTGAFPVTSKKGNKYIMILCEIDNNVIMSEAMRNRSSSEIFRTYLILMQRLKSSVIMPKKHVLENECSTEFKQATKENELEYELVPRGQHRRNLA